ncbi:MAG TPA: hypothetical protein VF614_08850 [Chthoniobacteraceae bacterium]|jgi:uncharacterized membrane protein
MADPDPTASGASSSPLFATRPTGSGFPPNIAAGLACIFSIIGGVIFLVLDRANRLVRFHSLQSIYLGIFILSVSLVFKTAELIFSQVPFVGKLLIWVFSGVHLVISVAWFVAYLISIVQAFANREWEVPFIGAVVRRQVAMLPK